MFGDSGLRPFTVRTAWRER